MHEVIYKIAPCYTRQLVTPLARPWMNAQHQVNIKLAAIYKTDKAMNCICALVEAHAALNTFADNPTAKLRARCVKYGNRLGLPSAPHSPR